MTILLILMLLKKCSYKLLLLDRRTIPTVETSKLCDLTINWCTYNDQSLQKCRWLSQAALNRGIQPVISCAETEGNELSCLDDIKKQTADVTVASSDYAYATLKYLLE